MITSSPIVLRIMFSLAGLLYCDIRRSKVHCWSNKTGIEGKIDLAFNILNDYSLHACDTQTLL